MSKVTHDAIQEQLIAARRNQILEAATTIFAEKGFQRSTIRDIAKEAGIADGTIYIYFENKMALMLGILDRLNESDQREEDFSQSANTDLDTYFRFYIRQRLEVLSPKGLQVIKIVLSEILVNTEMRALYYEKVIAPTFALADRFFQTWIDEGRIKPFDIGLMMRAISGMVMGLLVLRLIGDPTVEAQWEQLPDLITDMVLKGIQKE